MSLRLLTPLLPGVSVVNLRQHSGKNMSPESEQLIAPGDTLVLSGKIEALSLAEEKLLTG
jgi:CPA2 family monovalent cation:H+ antiporter-2